MVAHRLNMQGSSVVHPEISYSVSSNIIIHIVESIDNANSRVQNGLRFYMPSVIYTMGTRLLKLFCCPRTTNYSIEVPSRGVKYKTLVDSNKRDLSPHMIQIIYFPKWTKIWNQVNSAWSCSIPISRTRHGLLLDDIHQRQYHRFPCS